MIVDEAEEDLEMEEDPFHEEELPAVLEEENCFKKSVSRESRISVLERLERVRVHTCGASSSARHWSLSDMCDG